MASGMDPQQTLDRPTGWTASLYNIMLTVLVTTLRLPTYLDLSSKFTLSTSRATCLIGKQCQTTTLVAPAHQPHWTCSRSLEFLCTHSPADTIMGDEYPSLFRTVQMFNVFTTLTK